MRPDAQERSDSTRQAQLDDLLTLIGDATSVPDLKRANRTIKEAKGLEPAALERLRVAYKAREGALTKGPTDGRHDRAGAEHPTDSH